MWIALKRQTIDERTTDLLGIGGAFGKKTIINNNIVTQWLHGYA